MKFPNFSTAKPENHHIDRIDGGLSFTEEKDSTLVSCKNVWFQRGLLRNRPAITANIENILDNGMYRNGYSYYYPPCDIKVSIEEEEKQMVVEQIEYSDSQYICLTHFINSDGSYYSSAEMLFLRLSGTVFYMPENIVFFKGKSQNGGGIYAFVHLVNIENFAQTESRIYEISADFSAWERVTEFYVPTVYINGRGNNYEDTAATGQAFTEEPRRLEDLNLLDGTFHAYFSTDSRSSSFQLPFSDIANSRVTARFYYSLTEYVEWKIEAGKTNAKATFLTADVTMHVNRKKGIVYFTVPAGDYEIPMMTYQNANNLRITAKKEQGLGINDVAGSPLCKTIGNKVVFANKNLLFCTDYNNPLYFPASSTAVVGEKENPFTAFALQPERIVAFKGAETYAVTVEKGKPLNTISLLADNSSIFYGNDTLRVTMLSGQIGCKDKHSVVQWDTLTYWRNESGYFYVLKKGQTTVKCISEKVNSFIDANISTDFKTVGFKYKNYIIFVTNKNALAVEIDTKSPTDSSKTNFYYWKLPEQISVVNSYEFMGIPWLLCRNNEEEICYTATLGGNRDSVLVGSFYEPEVLPLPIILNFRTCKIYLNCENSKKKISEILLRIKTQEAKVSINDRRPIKICRYENPEKTDTASLKTSFSSTETVDIYLEAYGKFSLGTVDIKYFADI